MNAKTHTSMMLWNAMKYSKFLLLFLLLIGVVFATAAQKLNCVMKQICCIVKGVLPIIAFTLFVLAGVGYGIGNFFGAETRAKAQGWGMSALVGAVIMLVIYMLGPTIIISLYGTPTAGIGVGGTFTCSQITDVEGTCTAACVGI